MLDRTRPPRHVRVTLVMPLTGPAANLERLMRALDNQSLPPRRLVIAVESVNDPAHAAALGAARTARTAIEVVVAGEASRCGQKCWNQIAGLGRVDGDDDAVVLLDADIDPDARWLATAVRPLTADLCDISTGYRWAQLEQASLGGYVVAAIDRSIAVLPRPSPTRMVWGGTLALSRRAFSVLPLQDTLGTTLSDDCAIGERAAAMGLRLRTDRRLLVPTPLSLGLAQAWAFGRRQYQIIRIYRPWLYQLALTCMAARLATWAIIAAGASTAMSPSTAAAIILSLGLGSYAAQQVVARRLQIGDRHGAAIGQLALALALPLVDLLHGGMILGALGSSVRWGHVSYNVAGPSDVAVAERRPWGS
jgi:hypothetical protein